MAKITALPVAAPLAGTEHLPIVQAGQTKRVTMAAFRDLITPFLQYWYKGDRGFTGPANATYPTMAAIAASELTNLSAILAPSDDEDDQSVAQIYTFKSGDFSGRNDVIVSDHAPVTQGAWVPYDASALRYDGRPVSAKLLETVSVTEKRFAGGAKGDGVTDDTVAINAALRYGGRIVFPGNRTYKIAGRLLVTVPRTEVVLEAGCVVTGNPWRYAGGQNPFGSLFVVTASGCSIRGAGKGLSLLQLSGGSEANGVTFLHCDRGYVGFLTIDGAMAEATAIHDDTFGTGVAVFNTRGSNPSNTPSRFTFDHVEARNFIHYGGQVWGDLVEASVLDCDFERNGRADDPYSVGCGFAITFGVRNFLMSRTRLRANKRHGLLQSSAGLASHNLRITDSEVSDNGLWGLSFTEELNFFCKKGVGTNGIFTKGNTLKNNGAGGQRVGTYDNVGLIQNVTSDDVILDNQGHGFLVQTNTDPDAGVVRVSIDSVIVGNVIGVGMGVLVGESVKWNGLKIVDNATNIANSGQSRLVSNGRGFGGTIEAAPRLFFPPNGENFVVHGDAEIEYIEPDQGRTVTIIFGGSAKVKNTGNIKMQTPFESSGNATLMIVSSDAAWFEIARKVNS